MSKKSNLNVIRAWWLTNRQNGKTPASLLLRDMPKRVLLRQYAKACASLNAKILLRKNRRAIQIFHEQQPQLSGGHYYLIVMPDALHLLLPCIELLQVLNLAFIINGAGGLDAGFLLLKYPHIPQFRLTLLPGSSLRHGEVIDLLFSTNPHNFGIIDHDLFIFRPQALQDIRLDDHAALAYLYSHINPKTGLLFPTTHLMFFNTPLLKSLMNRYGLSALRSYNIPASIEAQINSLGLGYDNLPKGWVDFYDTMHLMIAMAHYEGYGFQKIGLANQKAVHIGQTTYGLKRMAYLWLYARLLELPCNREIKPRYWPKLIPFADKEELLDHFVKQRGYMNELAALNTTVNAIARHLEESKNRVEPSSAGLSRAAASIAHADS